MILLDTNVLLRAFLPHSERRHFLDAIASAATDGLVPHTLIGQLREVYVVLTRAGNADGRMTAAQGAATVEAILHEVPLKADEMTWMDAWLHLVKASDTRGVAAHDAYLAAAAMTLDCPILTADAGFRRYPGLNLRLVA